MFVATYFPFSIANNNNKISIPIKHITHHNACLINAILCILIFIHRAYKQHQLNEKK